MSNTVYVNPDAGKKKYLLDLLSTGLLDREGAYELRTLLVKEIKFIEDIKRKRRMIGLINNLDKYISGEVNLMLEPQVTKVSNLQ